MSTAVLPRGRSSRALEGMSWVGLIAGLLLIASASCLPAPRRPVAYAAISPAEFTAWVQAICTAVGLLTATANGLAIAIHRWGKPARRPRKQGDAEKGK